MTKFVPVLGTLDYILPFASPSASPIDYLKIPIQTLKVGSLGTHNLLGFGRVKKARILIASTSEVYGDSLQRQPDTTKAKVSRAEGIKITYDYFKSLSREALLKEEHKDFSKYIN
jgi:GDP-D-mannose dehydratase